MMNRLAVLSLLFTTSLSQSIISTGTATEADSGAKILSEGSVEGNPGAVIISSSAPKVVSTWASVNPTPTTWASIQGSLSSWEVLPTLTGSDLLAWYSSQGWDADSLTTETVVAESGQVETIVGPIGTISPSPRSSSGLSSGAKLGIGLGVGLGTLVVSIVLATLFIRRRSRKQFQNRTSGLRTMSERQDSA